MGCGYSTGSAQRLAAALLTTASPSIVNDRAKHRAATFLRLALLGLCSPRRYTFGIRRTGTVEYSGCEWIAYCTLMLAARITLRQFSVSSAINFPKSAGDPIKTVAPRSANRALIPGSARPALISLLSLSMIAAGVFLGTPTPNHALAS